MMLQYFEIKAQHPDTLLFYRMGDFYEMFFEDAQVASEALGITLTKRGRHQGTDIPMCGVPVHAAHRYLLQLIKQGHRVSVCDQTENPTLARKRGSKGVVRREVVQVVTPGTITEEGLLDARKYNYLLAIQVSKAQKSVALAWTDISTGELTTQHLPDTDLKMMLCRLSPKEILVSENWHTSPILSEVFTDAQEDRLTPLPDSRFQAKGAQRFLQEALHVRTLEAFGDFTLEELSAAGALLEYTTLTQKGKTFRLTRLQRNQEGEFLSIDPATLRNLEILLSLSGTREGSLLATVDRTCTAAGARLLRERLVAPLTCPEKISGRLDQVSFFAARKELRDKTRDCLRKSSDIMRILSRIGYGRAGPADLAAIRDTLRQLSTLSSFFVAAQKQGALPPALTTIAVQLRGDDDLQQTLTEALSEELPIRLADGGFIAQGYAQPLDRWTATRNDALQKIKQLQVIYARESKIGSLRVRHNNILGYFVEVPSGQAKKIPSGLPPELQQTFRHRQTTGSLVRYKTEDLTQLESDILEAKEKAHALEIEIFEDLCTRILDKGRKLSAAAYAMAVVDVAAALASLAAEECWTRPKVERSLAFQIKDGRHPIVEIAGRKSGQSFTPNHCHLEAEGRLWLITGPNMAGKSTFLRQNALICLLAQSGSFVPASDARIGVVDRLFSRVGAADDLARGRSTFMVEMVETASILRQARKRALVILDEIGRGTATFDGLAIAWATLEHLHNRICCRGLFATHYRELSKLTKSLRCLSCHKMEAREWKDEIVFLYTIASGIAESSYGIHVARLAGIPEDVRRRAQEVLKKLESGKGPLQNGSSDFAQDVQRAEKTVPSDESFYPIAKSVLVRLRSCDLDAMSPKQALDTLYTLRKEACKVDGHNLTGQPTRKL